MSKKVLYVGTVVKAHIAQFHIPYLKMLKEEGYETFVASRNDYENKEDCVIPYCDHYYDIKFERSPFSLKNINAYKELKELIDKENFDIVHCHTPVGGVLGRLASRDARRKGTKVFYTAHGFHFFKGAPLKNWLVYYPIEKLCAPLTDVLITINNEDYSLAKRKMKVKRIEYTPGIGVDIDVYRNVVINRTEVRERLNISKDCYLLCSVGELTNRKNHEFIINLLAQINNPNIHYVVVGNGVLHDHLLEVIRNKHLEKQVHLVGYRKDVNEILKASDLFVFPSKMEGLGLALIEAMAAGLYSINSNVTGPKELINSIEEGRTISLDNKEEWKQAIIDAYNNKTTARIDFDKLMKRDIRYTVNLLRKVYKEVTNEQ